MPESVPLSLSNCNMCECETSFNAYIFVLTTCSALISLAASPESSTWTTGITEDVLRGLLPADTPEDLSDLAELRTAISERLRSPPAAATDSRTAAPSVRTAARPGAAPAPPRCAPALPSAAETPAGGTLARPTTLFRPPAPAESAAPRSAGSGGFRFQPVRPPAPLFPPDGSGGGSTGYNVAAQVRSLMAPGRRQNGAVPQTAPQTSADRQPLQGRAGRGRGEQTAPDYLSPDHLCITILTPPCTQVCCCW